MTDQPFTYRQTYKNRAEAYHDLFAAKELPVSSGKFYADCLKYGLVQPDKSLLLADLLNYAETRLKIDPVTGQSLVDTDHAKEIEKLDLEEKRLKIEKLKREGRKDDADYKHIDVVNQREAALLRRILTELEYQTGKSDAAVIAACQGDETRQAETRQMIKEAIVYPAFRSIYESGDVDVTFEDEIE